MFPSIWRAFLEKYNISFLTQLAINVNLLTSLHKK